MKTKKVLALVVLAAMLISIMPFAALAANAINPYNTQIVAPSDSAETTIYWELEGGGSLGLPGTWKNEEDGNRFEVVFVGEDATSEVYGPGAGSTIYVASSRPTVDSFFYSTDKDGPWKLLTPSTANNHKVWSLDASGIVTATNPSIYIQVESATPGKPNIAFSTKATAVADYIKGNDFSPADSLTDIIGQTKYAIEFITAEPNQLKLTPESDNKPSNGVDSITLNAYVTVNGIPSAGKDVTFSIVSGTGASLTVTRATTNAAGRAESKVYSTRAGAVKIEAKVNNNAKGDCTVTFISTGVVSIKAESDNNQKVARNDSSQYKKFNFSAYDASGNRMDFLKMIRNAADTAYVEADEEVDIVTTYMTKDTGDVKLNVDIVSKPSGANLKDTDIKFSVHSSGNGRICVPINRLNKDGDYEIKIYLTNGVSVSYKFNAKDQGEVTKMILSYGASSYSAGTVLPQPDIKYQDAEGYETSDGIVTTSELKLSISDASFMDSTMTTKGQFKLKDDKSGVITMTAVDTSKNLVATQVLTVEKAASYLKLTPQSVGAVGGEVSVDIQLVDVDGKLAPSGLKAVNDGTSATVIAKPEGAIASASSVDISDFNKGKANVKVSSNVEGDVSIQVIITEEGPLAVPGSTTDKYGGRTYTGACTVSFGKTTAGGGQIIFIVGSSSYVSGNQVYASESTSFIENGRTYLGVRDMGNSIGATIEWDEVDTATLSKDGTVVKVTVGAAKITVTKNGVTTEVEIDAPAQNKNGRVYLPFRAVMEAFNYVVTFDQATNSIVCAL